MRRIAIIITGAVCVVAMWIAPPVRSQEDDSTQEIIPEQTTEEALEQPPGDATKAFTTSNPKVPIEELELLIQPLTIQELEDEAAGWMVLLQEKVKQISNTEIVINRQNRVIGKQKEIAKVLEGVKQSLAEVEKGQSLASPGSPEYETAVKKVEEARQNLQKVEEIVDEAAVTQKTLNEEDELKTAVEKSKETGSLELALQVLEAAKKEREQFEAGSFAYQNTTKKIAQLEAAIGDFEKAQEAQNQSKPDTDEHKKAAKKVDAAQVELKKAIEALNNTEQAQSNESNSETLDKTASTVDNIKVNVDNQPLDTQSSVKNQKDIKNNINQLNLEVKRLQQDIQVKSDLKNQLVATATNLEGERTEVIDRFNIVLKELNEKGGDTKFYNKYINSVSGAKLYIQDAEGLWVRLIAWLKSKEGGQRWGGNIINFASVLLVSTIVARLLANLVNRILCKYGDESQALRDFIVISIKRGGIVVGFLFALTAFEVSLGPLLVLVGSVSFVLAFALQNNLGNLASGLMIMVYKPFDVGDEIKLNEISGQVESISLANTNIRGFDGQMITVPNDMAWGQIIENWTTKENRLFKIWLDITLEQNLLKVEYTLLDIVKLHPDVLDNPPPEIIIGNIEGSNIKIAVSGWIKTDKFWKVNQDINRLIIERLQSENISINEVEDN